MSKTIEIQTLPEKRGLMMRRTCPHSAIGEALGQTLPALFGHIIGSGHQPTGAPSAIYFDWREDECDLAGFVPCAHAEPGEGMEVHTLPGGRAYTCLHVGPYHGLEATHSAVMAKVQADGVRCRAVWEEYLNDCEEVGMDNAETLVIWAIDED